MRFQILFILNINNNWKIFNKNFLLATYKYEIKPNEFNTFL